MLSVEQRKFDQLYAYRAGMRNTAWIAGVARHITARDGYIQQSNNINQMIHFQLDDQDKMPSWVKDGVNIKVVGRIHTDRNNNEPVVVLTALSIEAPSIYDMPPRAAWERSIRDGVPTDDVRPDTFKPEEVAPKMDGARVSDTGNMVTVAGFVSSFFVEAAGLPKEDGGKTQGCLILTLRQTKDANDLIPVRCYGKNPEATARRLEVGVPLKLMCKLRVRLKNTGEAADENGILPVHRYQYLHASNLAVANRDDIREEPDWAKTMVLESRSKRDAAKAKRAAKPATAEPATTQQASAAVPAAPVKAATPIAAPVALDAHLDFDPAALALLQSAPK